MQELPHTESCFVCGESNPVGLALRMHTDGKQVHVHFTPKPEHNGFKEVIHGGLLSTVLDEIMVWACAVSTNKFAFCAELNVRFLSPAKPGEALLGIAELVENRRDRIYETRGELRTASGIIVATATGRYMPLKADQSAAMLADFVAPPGTWKPREANH